jgi:hypothetical protein
LYSNFNYQKKQGKSIFTYKINKLLIFIGLFLFNPVSAQMSEKIRQDTFLKASVVSETSYVQAQLIYILQLYDRFSVIKSGEFSTPLIEHLEFQQLGDETDFQTQFQDQTYQVRERRYALFPKNKGQLTIPASDFIGRIALPESLCDPSFEYCLKKISLKSEAIRVNIQPKPPQFPEDNWWLPAQNLSLSEEWRFKRPFFQVGEPVIRILTLQAKGLMAKQLPELPPLENSYPESSQLEDHFENSGVIGERLQTFVLVPTKAGDYLLPPVKIPWWDSENQKIRYATLPAHSIYVSPSSRAFMNFSLMKFEPWAVIFALCWLITLFIWWWRTHFPATQSESPEPLNIKKARLAIKQACEQNDPKKTEKAVLDWAMMRWRNMTNLGNVARQLNDLEVKMVFNHLDRTLYAQKKVYWEGKDFWKVFEVFVFLQKTQTSNAKNRDNAEPKGKVESVLPKLYAPLLNNEGDESTTN